MKIQDNVKEIMDYCPVLVDISEIGGASTLPLINDHSTPEYQGLIKINFVVKMFFRVKNFFQKTFAGVINI